MFEDLILRWKGRSHAIQRDRVLGALASMENVLTLHELAGFLARDSVPVAKISTAYGAVLRHAYVEVSDAEVYAVCMGGDKEAMGEVIESMTRLLAMALPTTAEKPGRRKSEKRGARQADHQA